MDYVSHLLECYELSVSNFNSCYSTVEYNFQYSHESFHNNFIFFKFHSIVSDILYVKCNEIGSDSFVERRQAYIDSKGGIKACFAEMCKSCDDVNRYFYKLERNYNDIHQYYNEMLCIDIVNEQDVSLVKRLGVERTKCDIRFKYVYNKIGGCCSILGKKIVLIN